MIFRNITFLFFSICLLVSAQENVPSNPSDTGNNRTGDTAVTDTTEIVGTIESVNLQDSMIVINTEAGTDTVYYNSKTDFSTKSAQQILKLNTLLRVKYIAQGDKNLAILIEPATAEGKTPPDTGDTTPPSPGNDQGTPPLPGE